MKSNNQHIATSTSTASQAKLAALGQALMALLPASPGVAYTGPLTPKRANGHANKANSSHHHAKGTRVSVAQRHRISEGMKASWARRRAEAEAQGKTEVTAQANTQATAQAPAAPKAQAPASPSKVSPKGPTLAKNMTPEVKHIVKGLLLIPDFPVKKIAEVTGFTRAAIHAYCQRLRLGVHTANTRPDVRKAREAARKASSQPKVEMTITPTTSLSSAPAPVNEAPAQIENTPALATA